MRISLFIAKRIRARNTLATAGVAIGVAVMIITVAIVTGFKNTVRDKVIGFGSHIQVMNFLASHGIDPYPICADDSLMGVMSSIEGVKNVQRYATAQGILKTEADYLPMTFKGVGPEYDMTFLRSCIVAGECPTMSDSTNTGAILLSRSVAAKLQTGVGDHLFAYFVSGDDVRTRRFTISGIYETCMSRFDDNIAITDLHTVTHVAGWSGSQVSGAELLVADLSTLDATMQAVVKVVNRGRDSEGHTLSSQTIYDAYPQVFAWLELLDINVLIILVLMVCVAGFTMVAGLLIIILERTQLIGILKALGARGRVVRRVFLWLSTFIIVRGMVIGDVIGLGLIALQKVTGIAKLDPQTYYVSEVPVEVHIAPIVALNVATLVICIVALVGPSHLISSIRPAQVMKYE